MGGGVSAVILAAGASQRMGDVNKLLADWQGKPVIRHVVETALKSDSQETIVVIGHQSDAIKDALDGLDVRFVDNPDYEEGMSTSLKAGVSAVAPESAGMAVLLADMPQLKGDTLNALIATFQSSEGAAICAPHCQGRQGNPVIWPKDIFPDIITLTGDKGAKSLLKRHAQRVIEVPCDDDGVLRDLDTPDDFKGAS